jgi:metal-responsive CopG/Arc/MetJ family transcriptional regulator
MKTAISIPDKTYKRIGRAVRRLKMSRSRFFLEAAEAYLNRVDRDSITEQINKFIADNGQMGIDPVVRAHTNRMMLKVEWK